MNQLLTEIDGVGAKKNVFFIGATNRPELLDEALLRLGRLGQPVYISLPDLPARQGILEATLKKAPIAPNVPIPFVAQKTEGFSGADLAELCQCAAKAAVRDFIVADELKAGDDDAMATDLGNEISRKIMPSISLRQFSTIITTTTIWVPDLRFSLCLSLSLSPFSLSTTTTTTDIRFPSTYARRFVFRLFALH